MSVYTSGIDVGSTYTNAVILKDGNEIVSRAQAALGRENFDRRTAAGAALTEEQALALAFDGLELAAQA